MPTITLPLIEFTCFYPLLSKLQQVSNRRECCSMIGGLCRSITVRIFQIHASKSKRWNVIDTSGFQFLSYIGETLRRCRHHHYNKHHHHNHHHHNQGQLQRQQYQHQNHSQTENNYKKNPASSVFISLSRKRKKILKKLAFQDVGCIVSTYNM